MSFFPYQKIVLYAENNPADRSLIREAMKEVNVSYEMQFVADGEELLDYLNHKGKYEDKKQFPLPHIILMDNDMPRVNGLEALKILKENDQFRKIPVIGFSTTEDPQKIQQFYQAGATAYIIKSIDFSGLAEALKSIEDFWFQIVRLPDPNTY